MRLLVLICEGVEVGFVDGVSRGFMKVAVCLPFLYSLYDRAVFRDLEGSE